MHEIANDVPVSTSAACSALLEATAALQPSIRGYQEETERGRHTAPALVEQLRAAGLYRMLIPQELGGLQVDPLTYSRCIELAAEADGAVGWNIANHGICQMAALSLPEEGVQEIFERGPDLVCAGTLVPGGGRGVPADGGYVVTGRWRFGSGCQESDWMLANFHVFDGDEPRRGPDGKPVLWRVFFPATDCTVIETWDVTGLQGTGSHDWSVSEVFVPERRTARVGVPMTNQWTRWPGSLFALPTSALIGLHQSSVATGVARAGIDALTELAGRKTPRARTGLLRDREQVQEWVGRAEALLGAGRAYRAAVAAEIWETVAAGRPTTPEQRARCRLAGSYAAECAMQAMDLMYRAGGTTSIERGHPLAKCWHDVHAVAQANSVHPEWFALSGRVFLGMEPDARLS